MFPTILLTCAGILFALRGLKAQGRLGDDFGKVVIRDQPPTNTIQKIMALKDALTALEDFLQNMNISLLKLRSAAFSRHLHVSTLFFAEFFGYLTSSRWPLLVSEHRACDI